MIRTPSHSVNNFFYKKLFRNNLIALIARSAVRLPMRKVGLIDPPIQSHANPPPHEIFSYCDIYAEVGLNRNPVRFREGQKFTADRMIRAIGQGLDELGQGCPFHRPNHDFHRPD